MSKKLFFNVFNKVEEIHTKFNINYFPIEIDKIEHIFSLLGYSVEYMENINKTCLIGKEIIVGTKDFSFEEDFDGNNYEVKLREVLAHELGHIICHDINQLEIDNISLSKGEAQADAFSLYFLIPDYALEEYLRENSYELLEKNYYNISRAFGVSREFLKKRIKFLSKNNRNKIKYDVNN